jgi:hypothetical protein
MTFQTKNQLLGTSEPGKCRGCRGWCKVWKAWISNPDWRKSFLSSKMSIQALGPAQTSVQWVPGSFSSGTEVGEAVGVWY